MANDDEVVNLMAEGLKIVLGPLRDIELIERAHSVFASTPVLETALRVGLAGPALDDDEDWAMTRLIDVMNRIIRDWGLRYNNTELIGAVHTIQSFIVQHMLHRLNPAFWGDWYAPAEPDKTDLLIRRFEDHIADRDLFHQEPSDD